MKINETQEPFNVELMLVCAEIQAQENKNYQVRFGSKMNEEILIKMCKEDPSSWELVKKVIFDSLDKVETACGYKFNDIQKNKEE